MDKGGIKAAKIIEILKNARLQDCTPSPANELLAVPRDIANVIASNRSEAKGGLTDIEAAIELLQKLGWRYTFLQDKNGRLTDVLCVPRNCLNLLVCFPSVLFMDCTYKTNTAQLPHLNVVGCTNKYSTFPVAFGLLGGETKKTFGWALHWLNQHTSLRLGSSSES